jgi:ArsR family transcriptional regulator
LSSVTFRQAYLSQQLAVLRRAGGPTESREGLFVYYRVATAEVIEALDAAEKAVGPRSGPRGIPANCECPHCREKQ